MYAKVFTQIFDSSIAGDYKVRHFFEDMLKLADLEGVVDMTADAIARRTNVPIELVLSGLEALMKPDPTSRSKEEEGRRIVLIDSHRDWGWKIVNYEHYRNLRDEEARRGYFRDYMRNYRAKAKRNGSRKTLLNSVKPRQPMQRQMQRQKKGERNSPLSNCERISLEKELKESKERVRILKLDEFRNEAEQAELRELRERVSKIEKAIRVEL